MLLFSKAAIEHLISIDYSWLFLTIFKFFLKKTLPILTNQNRLKSLFYFHGLFFSIGFSHCNLFRPFENHRETGYKFLIFVFISSYSGLQ